MYRSTMPTTSSVQQPKMFLGLLKEYQLKGLQWLVNCYEQVLVCTDINSANTCALVHGFKLDLLNLLVLAILQCTVKHYLIPPVYNIFKSLIFVLLIVVGCIFIRKLIMCLYPWLVTYNASC